MPDGNSNNFPILTLPEADICSPVITPPLELILFEADIGPKILTLLADVNSIISWPLSLLLMILNLPRWALTTPVLPASITPLLACIWVEDSLNEVAPPTNILLNEPVKLVVVQLALILPEAVILFIIKF